MKRILISAVAAGALLGQLGAFEVVNDGEKSLSVFGVANAVIGYGHNLNDVSVSTNANGVKTNTKTHLTQDEFIYGIQGNSRIGLSFTYGKLFGAALIGAGESTLLGGTDKAGFRQLYAGYDFGDAGKILAGKNELVTSMSGFSSSIFDTESGLQGFGGTSTSTRRLQVAYSIAGLTVSLSENDISGKTLAGSGYEIPRLSLGYEYNADGLVAKVAASYAYSRLTKEPTTDGPKRVSEARSAAVVTAGAKYDLGGSYVSGVLTYGFNADKIGEGKIAEPTLGEGFMGSINVSTAQETTSDSHLAAVALEYGINLTNDLGLKIGAGYQYSIFKGDDRPLHSYAAFVQTPYNVGGGFSIIPQVGYIGTTTTLTKKIEGGKSTETASAGNVLAEVLFKLAF